VRFDLVPVKWADWVAAWARDQTGKTDTRILLGGVQLLPTVNVPAVP
jgi:hypothetical protein